MTYADRKEGMEWMTPVTGRKDKFFKTPPVRKSAVPQSWELYRLYGYNFISFEALGRHKTQPFFYKVYHLIFAPFFIFLFAIRVLPIGGTSKNKLNLLEVCAPHP